MINYVLCCWSGARRIKDARRDADPAFYLKAHLAALHRYRHDLDQITVVVPHNPAEPPAFRAVLNSLPDVIQGAKVVCLERPNVGLSYGSFSDAYKTYRTRFDYYFFIEDDYVFPQDGFDRIHLEVMAADPGCGYVCGLVWNGFGHPWHAGIANGLFRTEALEKVFVKRGRLPHAGNSGYTSNEVAGQIGQSRAIMAQGYGLRDWAGRYRVGFRELDFSVDFYNTECPECIMEPI